MATAHMSDAGQTLRSNDWWEDAMDALKAAQATRGPVAETRARKYGDSYRERRAAMVFDVVASRQRGYLTRVLPMVERFERRNLTLIDLAELGPGDDHGLRSGEADTMQCVAAGLVRYSSEHGLSEEDGVRAWAVGVGELEHAPDLDPYVGAVKGIGPALFAYIRMRCGADALKPDLRVYRALRSFGFKVPRDEHALLIVSAAAAAELGISRLVLDQMLWWDESPPT
jgi:hypothetical protein